MSFADGEAKEKPFRLQGLLKSSSVGQQRVDMTEPPVGKAQRSCRTMMTPCAKALPLFLEYQRRLREAEEFKRQSDSWLSHGYGRPVTIDDPVFEDYRRQLLFRVNSPYAWRTLSLVSSEPKLAPVGANGPLAPAAPEIDSGVIRQLMDPTADDPAPVSDGLHAPVGDSSPLERGDEDEDNEDFDLYSEFGLVGLLPSAAHESGTGSSSSSLMPRASDQSKSSSAVQDIRGESSSDSHLFRDTVKKKKKKKKKKSKTSKKTKSPSKKAKKSRR